VGAAKSGEAVSARRWWQGEQRIAARCATCGKAIAVGEEGATFATLRGVQLGIGICGACVVANKAAAEADKKGGAGR
jgi:hypothetical protein